MKGLSIVTVTTAVLIGMCSGAASQTTEDLALTLGSDNADLQAGISGLDSAALTAMLENQGSAEATVELHVPLADGLQITPGMAPSATPGSYDPSTGIWSIGMLPGGASATLVIPITLDVQASGCLIQTAELVNAPEVERSLVIGAGNCSDLQAQLRVFPETCLGIEGIITIRIVREVQNGGPNPADGVVALVAGNDNAPDASCTAAMSCALEPAETVLVAARDLPVECSDRDQVFNFELEVSSSQAADPNVSNNKASQIHTVAGVTGGAGGGSGGGAALLLWIVALLQVGYRRATAAG